MRPGHLPTEMTVRWQTYKIRFQIEGDMPMRLRRTLALGIFRSIKALIRSSSDVHISHDDAKWADTMRVFFRGVSLKQAVGLETAAQKRGMAIRLLRLDRGLTQKDLAATAHLSRAQLSRIEHGRMAPRQQTLDRIARALNVRKT